MPSNREQLRHLLNITNIKLARSNGPLADHNRLRHHTREHRALGTTLQRVPDPRRRRRGPSARHRPRASDQAVGMVLHPRDVRGRWARHRRLGAGQKAEWRQGGFDDWERVGYLWWAERHIRGVLQVE